MLRIKVFNNLSTLEYEQLEDAIARLMAERGVDGQVFDTVTGNTTTTSSMIERNELEETE